VRSLPTATARHPAAAEAARAATVGERERRRAPSGAAHFPAASDPMGSGMVERANTVVVAGRRKGGGMAVGSGAGQSAAGTAHDHRCGSLGAGLAADHRAAAGTGSEAMGDAGPARRHPGSDHHPTVRPPPRHPHDGRTATVPLRAATTICGGIACWRSNPSHHAHAYD